MNAAQRLFPACPLGCSTTLESTGLGHANGTFDRCPECGQMLNQVSEDYYVHTPNMWDHSDGTMPDARSIRRSDAMAARRLKGLTELLGKPPQETRLLDVGCSSGAFLKPAVALGYQAEGCEPAAKAAESAIAAGFKVYVGMLEDAHYPGASFDGVALFEVIEHLTKPIPLLKEIHRILKPGGILVMSTGNSLSWTASVLKQKWEFFRIEKLGGHVSFFNPRSMQVLAERSGFTLERLQTRRVRLAEKDYSSKPVYVAGKLAAELLSAPAKLLGKGHDMLVYFRKQG